ncbi:MAG: HAD family hydrolase [Alphaproteobacteria bacterium]
MNQYPKKLTAVLFDMDGTLVDSEDLHYENVVAVCAEYGYEFTAHDNMRFMGHSMTNIFNALKPDFPSDITFERFFDDNLARFEKTIKKEHLFPGVLDTLQYLKSKNIPMFVVTNGEQKAADVALSKTEIIHYFKGVITAAQVTKAKPDPQPYLLAAQNLNIPIEQCLIVEDSATGATSGIKAGGYVIALDHTMGRDQLQMANKIVTNFAEIPFKSLF